MQNNFKIKPIISLSLFLIGIVTIISLLGKVLIPFLIALILTYILHPLVEKIHQKSKINLKILSATTSILILLTLISIPIFIIPALITQIKIIIADIPSILALINSKICNPLNLKYNLHLVANYDSLKDSITQSFGALTHNPNIVSPIARNSFVLLEIIAYLFLIPFIIFYMLINWNIIIIFLKKSIPKSHREISAQFIRDLDRVLSSYLHGQITVVAILMIYYIITLNFINLSGATFVGIITGSLAFIPYIGFFIGFITSIIICIAHFTDINQLVYILIIFTTGHFLESWIITPFLIGGKIGLNPIMIIFALMIFGQLFGLAGVLLALPLAAITTVFIKYLKVYYLNSDYYNETDT